MAVAVQAQNPVEEFVNNDLHRNSNISLLIQEADGGKIVASHRANHVAAPASTMKVITTATALEILGKDYRFKTDLLIDGELTLDGILNGNIIVYGSGDPTLGSAKLGDIHFLNDWLKAVKNLGIKSINGNIIADASIYDTEGINPKWIWEDIGNYYAAGAYGISYKDNTYYLEFKSGEAGTTPQITSTTPNMPELQFTNHVKSANINYDNAYIYGAPYSVERVIYGQIPANRSSFSIKGDIPNPALTLSRDFAWKLRSNGIEVKGAGIAETVGKRGEIFYTHQSPPLGEIIREINVVSNNHYAEQVFRHLALQKGEQASTQNAIAVVRDFWKAKGLSVDQLFMRDGSGLSPTNAVSASFYVSLLDYMAKSPNHQTFFNSLPIAGKEGTLKTFLKNTVLEGKVHAKSGTIGGVRTYTGYVERNNKTYIFAILVNYPNASSLAPTTKKMEQLLIQASK